MALSVKGRVTVTWQTAEDERKILDCLAQHTLNTLVSVNENKRTYTIDMNWLG